MGAFLRIDSPILQMLFQNGSCDQHKLGAGAFLIIRLVSCFGRDSLGMGDTAEQLFADDTAVADAKLLCDATHFGIKLFFLFGSVCVIITAQKTFYE